MKRFLLTTKLIIGGFIILLVFFTPLNYIVTLIEKTFKMPHDLILREFCEWVVKDLDTLDSRYDKKG